MAEERESPAVLIDPPQMRPALAGGPYDHRFEDGKCRVCGYRERSEPVGCPWNSDIAIFRNPRPARRER